MEKLPNIENMDLSSCHIVVMPKTLFETNPRMRSINISNNYLININIGVFNHLMWLESLDLSSNYFMDLTEDFFTVVRKMPRLKMVFLQVCCWFCLYLGLCDWSSRKKEE